MESFLSEFSKQLKNEWGDQLHKVLIVFNNKRPISFLQQHLGNDLEQPIWSPQFKTIDEWIGSLDTSYRMDEIETFFVLHKLYNHLLEIEGKNSMTQDEFLSFSEIIIQDFNQIMNYRVEAKSLFTYLEDVAKIEATFPSLTEDQQQFLHQFWSSIAHDSPIEPQQRFVQLWGRIKQLFIHWEQYLKDNEKTVLSYSFHKIAEDPQKYCSESNYEHIYFVGFNAIHPALQTIIQYLKNKGHATLVHDWDDYYVNNPLNKAGLFFREQEPSSITDIQIPNNFIKDKKIHVYGMEGGIAQAKYLNDLLPIIINDQQVQMEEVAIVLTDEDLAVPVMQSIPDDLEYNLSMGYPLQFSITFRWIDWFLSLQESYLNKSKMRIPKELFLEVAHLFKLENEQNNIELYEKIVAEHLNATYISVSSLEQFQMPLMLPIQTSIDLLNNIREFLFKQLNLLDTEEEQQSLEVNLMLYSYKIFESFHHTILQSSYAIEERVLIKLLRKKLESLNVPLSGYNLKAIQVLGLLETRALDFKKVIVLSANEGLLPSLSQRPSLIPDSIRRAFILPVLEHQDALVAHVFYSLIQRAEEIHILYDQTVSLQSTGEVSRFIQQIAFESQHKVNDHHQQQKILPAQKIQPYSLQREDAVQQQIEDVLLHPQRSFTASVLNSYLSCPLVFYMKYILGYKEKEYINTTLDPATVGTIIHELMYKAYEPYIGKEVQQDEIKAIKKSLNQKVLKGIQQFLGIEEENAEVKILAKITEHSINAFLRLDQTHCPFKIIDLENDQKGDGGHRVSIDVADPKGRLHQVNIRIIADRIDLYQGVIRVIDYKTGGIEQLSVRDLDELFTKKNRKSHISAIFQLMLYAWVFQKQSGTNQVVLPQIWSSRILSQETNNLYIKIGEVEINPDIDKGLWNNILQQFEVKLIELIQEIIFDTDQIIEHNIDNNASYCDTSEFSIFCLGS